MLLRQEGEQIFREESSEFRNEQERLTDSARKHIEKACVAGMVTGLTFAAVPPAGAVIGLELVHQLGAATVDLAKHESNERKHKSQKNTSAF